MKKVYFNPGDPYYGRRIFSKMHGQVYDTSKVMNIISPRDHRGLSGKTRDEIK